jgi:hypothetical protein
MQYPLLILTEDFTKHQSINIIDIYIKVFIDA